MACINHNDITYKRLLELSGLTQLELDAKVRQSLETTGEYPFIEQIVSSDTIPALVKKYNLTKAGEHYVAKDSDLIGVDAPYLNSIYRDLEITITPLFDGESLIDIKKRATINRDLEVADMNPGIYTKYNDNLFPQPIQVVNGNYIYQHDGVYYISDHKVGSYTALQNLPKTKNFRTAYSKATPSKNSYEIPKDALRFISKNLGLLSAGQNALYSTKSSLPPTITYYGNFNYPKYKVDTSIKDKFTVDNDGTILINPKHIENLPKALERTLLEAEGFLNSSEIEEVLQGLQYPITLETLKVNDGQYLLRQTNKDITLNDYNGELRNGNLKINRLESLLDRLSDLYGIKFNRVTSSELRLGGFKEVIPDATRVNAFILNGEIYINMDNANEDAPIHELSHMLLGTLKSTDYDVYAALVNSVETLDDYDDRLEEFPNRTRMDANEEIFVDMFAKHFTENLELPVDGNLWNKAEYEIKRNIDSAIFPNESTTKVSLDSLSGKSFSEIMDLFGTSISEESLANAFNGNESATNRKLANIKEDLLKQGLLKEYCE